MLSTRRVSFKFLSAGGHKMVSAALALHVPADPSSTCRNTVENNSLAEERRRRFHAQGEGVGVAETRKCGSICANLQSFCRISATDPVYSKPMPHRIVGRCAETSQNSILRNIPQMSGHHQKPKIHAASWSLSYAYSLLKNKIFTKKPHLCPKFRRGTASRRQCMIGVHVF